MSSGIIDADTEPVERGDPARHRASSGTAGRPLRGAPTFNAFPLTGPPECSVATCPAGFATLEPSTNPDQLSNESGHFASICQGRTAG